MKQVPHANHDGLSRELEELTRLNRHNLVVRWTSFFDAAPPPHTSRSLMIRAVAYKMQERAFGSLKASTRRILARELVSAVIFVAARCCSGSGRASPIRSP